MWMKEEEGWIKEEGRMAKEKGFPHERCSGVGCIH